MQHLSLKLKSLVSTTKKSIIAVISKSSWLGKKYIVSQAFNHSSISCILFLQSLISILDTRKQKS